MGQLEHLGPKLRAGRQQGFLGRRLDVTGEQDTAFGDVDPHHQGGVVARQSTRPRRPEWRDLKIGEALASIPPSLLGHLDLALLGRGDERREGRGSPTPWRKPQQKVPMGPLL